MKRLQTRHFDDAEIIMGLYVKEYFDPFRPDELINKLIDRCCTIRQNINKPLSTDSLKAPVNISQRRSAMTLVGVITGYVELRFDHYSTILEPGELAFMPPGSVYLVLSVVDKEYYSDRKYEARIVYAEYPAKINYF
ncbi:hypothetical protein BOX15_Mlig006085g1 [Macrostomum lignano]|uniref:Uncharacterized protein n=1 Tax=Macrostomum lignano TaxID=282301 RepID=A0A267DFQ0_9PLAT|nr:hypothetical protein BOX15_Mlig006085g1 [Macrostomum lignano]